MRKSRSVCALLVNLEPCELMRRERLSLRERPILIDNGLTEVATLYKVELLALRRKATLSWGWQRTITLPCNECCQGGE